MGQAKPLQPCGQISSCNLFRKKSKWCWCPWWSQQTWRICVIVRSPSTGWQTVTSKRHGLVHPITSLRPLWSSRDYHPGDKDYKIFLVMPWLKACSPYWGWVKCSLSLWCHYNTFPSLFFGIPTSYKLLLMWHFFFCSSYVWVVKVVLCLCVHACVCLHVFKTVAGIVD